ncbi:MAG: iron ABC transporter permease [Aquisalimonadaceae bacterium]
MNTTTARGAGLLARHGRHWPRPNGITIIGILLLIALGFLVLYPLLLLVVGSFLEGLPSDPAAALSLEGWRAVFTERRVLGSLANTLILGFTYTIISLPLALGIAWLLARTDIPGSGWLEFGFWVSFFLPTLGVVQGWILLLDPSFGLLNTALRDLFGLSSGPFNIYSMGGIVFAHLVTNAVSAKVMLMTPAFRIVDSSLEEASRIAGDTPLQTLRRILVPILAPTVLVITVLGIIRSLESFEIELILGTPHRIDVYSTLIYRLVQNDPPDYQIASALGVAIMMLMAVLIWLQFRAVRRRSFTTVTGKHQTRLLHLGAWRWPAFTFVALILVVLVAAPVAFLIAGTAMTIYGFFDIPNAWSLMHWREVLGDRVFVGSLWNTLKLAGGAALFTMTVCFIIAYFVVRSGFRGASALDLLSWVPFSMPGVLFSLAFLWVILSTPLISALYGSTLLLILAVSLTTLTLGVQIIKTALIQLAPELEEASLVSRATLPQTLWRITVPLAIQAILVAGIMGFITAGRNIGHLALLVTSDNRPLAILQLEYMVEGRYEAAAVVGTVVALATIVVALIARATGLRMGIRT